MFPTTSSRSLAALLLAGLAATGAADPGGDTPWLAAIRPPLCAPEQSTAQRDQLVCQDYQQRLDAGLEYYILVNNHNDAAEAIAVLGSSNVAAWGPTFFGNDFFVAEVPVCPAGGTYTANGSASGPNITCSFLSGPNPHAYPTQPAYPFGLTPDEQRWRCQQHQLRLFRAVDQFVLEENLAGYDAAIALLGTDINTWGPTFFGPGSYIPSIPLCPSGGTYVVSPTDPGATIPISCSLSTTAPYLHEVPPRAGEFLNDETTHGRFVYCQHLQQRIDSAISQIMVEESLPTYAAFLAAYGSNVSGWTSTTNGPGKFLGGVPACPAGGVYLLDPPETSDEDQFVACSFQDAPFPHLFPEPYALRPEPPVAVDLNGIMTGYDWCVVYQLGGGSVPLVDRTTAYVTGSNTSPDAWTTLPNARATLTRNACQQLQMLINDAANQYSLENGLADRDAFIAQFGTTLATWPGVLAGPGLVLRRVPICPDGGTYTLQSPGVSNACPVRCSVQSGFYPHSYPDICSQAIPPTPTPAPVVVATSFLPPDPDTIIGSMAFVIENAVESGEVLTLSSTPGLTISGSNSSLVIATGPAPVRLFVQALRTLRYDYRPSSQPPPAISGMRTIRVVAYAGGVPSAPAFASVTIMPGSSYLAIR